MPNNKLSINPETLKKLIYPGIFLVYITGLIISFIYLAKFIAHNLDLAFAPAPDQATLEKSAQLDLENYAALSAKLRLEMPVKSPAAPVAPVVTPSATPALATPPAIPEIAAAPETVTTTAANTTAETAPTMAPALTSEKTAWKIAVINSTTRSGLAGELKKQLEAAGYQVLKTGNQSPVEDSTIVKLKTGLDRNSAALTTINQIISEKYNFIVAAGDASSAYDIEIIIGNR